MALGPLVLVPLVALVILLALGQGATLALVLVQQVDALVSLLRLVVLDALVTQLVSLLLILVGLGSRYSTTHTSRTSIMSTSDNRFTSRTSTTRIRCNTRTR